MLKLGSLVLDATPHVAVGFTDAARPSDIEAAKEEGVDVAEIRIDQFRSHNPSYVAEKLASYKSLPILSTIRLESEGGAWNGPESDRERLYNVIIPYSDAIDIELAATTTLEKIGPEIKRQGKLLVVSFHDTNTTPSFDRLENVVLSAKAAGADIVKIATLVTKPDHITILTNVLTKHADKNLIVIGMGPQGLVTRLFFPSLGSLLTFAALAGQPSAPGQLPYTAMLEQLRMAYPSYNEAKIVELKLMEFV